MIHNLSDHTLTEDEFSVLTKGLSFVPTPSRTFQHEMNISWNKFKTRMLTQYFFLQDHTTYKPLTHNLTSATAKDACTLIEYLRSQYIIDKATIEFLLPHSYYLITSTHTSSMDFPKFTSQTAFSALLFLGVMVHLFACITHFIQPLASNLPSHIKDTKHFLILIENLPPLSSNAFLVTVDIISLYINIPHEEGIAAVIHFMEKYKHLLSTNCPPPHIVRAILDFILKHSTFKFMDTHIHQVRGTSMGTRMAPPYANLFMGKEERNIILTFLHLIYFWKCFIDEIFFILLGSHSQLNSLTTFMNTISPTIKYTFTYSQKNCFFP